MSQTLTIFRKELRSYIVSPIPYVFTIIFTAFMAWFFFYLDDSRFFVIGKASLESFFQILPWVLIFLVPAISMRLWSEEFREGTLEILMTLPVRTGSLAFGKFLSAWALLLICFLLTLPIPISVAAIGDLDWGPVVGGYLGAFLLGGALLSLGVWISSITRHQIVAFLISLLIGFLLIIVHNLAGTASTNWDAFLKNVSLRAHYDSMGRGVIDLRDLLYFLSFMGLFVYLNVQAIENRRVR